MKKNNLFLGLILFFAMILQYSCSKDDPVDNSGGVNELILTAGHFDEPEEYTPEQVGEQVVTVETDSVGVEYQVTTTKYKRAKKITSYKDIGSSKKGINNTKSTNDIYLGSVIQGKYWHGDGDLTSIGDFSRAPLTITLKDVILTNGNSVTVEDPNNANVTDAFNQLISSEYSGDISANYTFNKTEAHTKNQVGLELGFKPTWLGDMFNIELGIENTFETNTIVVYFKQVYYTAEVDLPGNPSGFFTDDVDLEGLKTKITSDNPAGYISSIDYGRVIMAKVTSANSTDDISAAIGLAFEALSINIGGHYEDVLNDCDFECKILGGTSGTVVQNAQGVIDLINEGMSPTSLTAAKPISYQVNYLDGGIFRIGDLVEYDKKEYLQTSVNQDFDVHFYAFFVFNDCDFLTDGDFSYTIDINGQEISQDNLTCGNDELIWIEQTKSLSLPFVSGQKIIVSGSLYENDKELVKSFVKEFEYPWNDEDLFNANWNIQGTATDLWEEYLKRNDDCDASLLFKVEKK